MWCRHPTKRPHRPGEVEHLPGPGQDLVHVAQVGLDNEHHRSRVWRPPAQHCGRHHHLFRPRCRLQPADDPCPSSRRELDPNRPDLRLGTRRPVGRPRRPDRHVRGGAAAGPATRIRPVIPARSCWPPGSSAGSRDVAAAPGAHREPGQLLMPRAAWAGACRRRAGRTSRVKRTFGPVLRRGAGVSLMAWVI